MKRLSIFIVLALFIFAGCSTPQGKGAAIGGASGAVLGGIIGHQSGHGLAGAGIGAAVGAVSGAVIADHMTTKVCPTCGRQFTTETEYCPYDGTKLEDIQK